MIKFSEKEIGEIKNMILRIDKIIKVYKYVN